MQERASWLNDLMHKVRGTLPSPLFTPDFKGESRQCNPVLTSDPPQNSLASFALLPRNFNRTSPLLLFSKNCFNRKKSPLSA